MRLAANLSLLFKELPLLQRPTAAAKAGFGALEVQFPYEESAQDWAEALAEAGLPLVLMNLSPGNWGAGERGLSGLPNRRREFKDSVASAIAYATTLKCQLLHCLAGLRDPAFAFEQQWDCYRENLLQAAKEAAKHGLTLLIEVLNPKDNPGYLLCDFDRALALLGEIGAPNLKLQFDAYHLAVLGLSLRDCWQSALPFTQHVQIADQPGRHEPGSGTIDFAGFFAVLRKSNYRGWIGCEYLPATTTQEGLGWRQRFGFSSSIPE